jgi:hypothetical protein
MATREGVREIGHGVVVAAYVDQYEKTVIKASPGSGFQDQFYSCAEYS